MRRPLPFSAVLSLVLLVFSVGPVAGQERSVLTEPLASERAAASHPVDTFEVTLEERSSEHPYENGYFEVFVVDGSQGKELTLEKGRTYLFEMNNVPEHHPFYLTTSPIGFGSDPYDEGVEGNGAVENEELTFTPSTDAPDSLWYQCINHDRMGWRMALTEATASAEVDSDETVSIDGTGVTVDFSGVTGSGEVEVSKFNSAPDGRDGISESNVSEYRFGINAGGDLSFDDGTEVRFDVGTLLGIGDASNVTIYRRDSMGTGSFSALSTTYDADAKELVATADGFSEFVFASNSESLPVELTNFDARTDDRAVELRWQTVSETNNAGFQVQRRVVGEKSTAGAWTVLQFIESEASNGAEPRQYGFRDASLPFAAERLVYRLKQVDTDGTEAFIGEATVNLDAPRRVALHAAFPNPTSGSATLRYELPTATDVRLDLYNTLGQRVATLAEGRQSAGRQEVQIQVPDLASGTYLVRLKAGQQVRIRKLAVLR